MMFVVILPLDHLHQQALIAQEIANILVWVWAPFSLEDELALGDNYHVDVLFIDKSST
jgi:hypothetical protein